MDATAGESTMDAVVAEEKSSQNNGVYTYHCICAQLLFASTTPLSTLARRSKEHSSDDAYILSLRAPPDPEEADASSFASHHAMILSASPLPTPSIVRLEAGGFDKRWSWRCARCDLVWGYQLDWAQWVRSRESATRREGRREDVVYVLPGSVKATDEMGHGQSPP